MPEEPRPRKAVLYLRVARDDHNRFARAIAAQRHACQRRAAELELEITREYVDHGSGLSLQQRPHLTELLDELKELGAGYVITYGHAQLSRDVKLYASILWAIRKAGARLEIASLLHFEPDTFALLLIGRVGELQLAELQAPAEQGDETGRDDAAN